MAAGWVRHLARDRTDVYSGGSNPGKQLNPAAVEAMREVGIDISTEYPKPFDTEAVKAADAVITMGCGDSCPIFIALARKDRARIAAAHRDDRVSGFDCFGVERFGIFS